MHRHADKVVSIELCIRIRPLTKQLYECMYLAIQKSGVNICYCVKLYKNQSENNKDKKVIVINPIYITIG